MLHGFCSGFLRHEILMEAGTLVWNSRLSQLIRITQKIDDGRWNFDCHVVRVTEVRKEEEKTNERRNKRKEKLTVE